MSFQQRAVSAQVTALTPPFHSSLFMQPKWIQMAAKGWVQGCLLLSSFTMVDDWKQPKCLSTKESISKLWCFHTMKYYQPKRVGEVKHYLYAREHE